ncbi:hypothetical protein LMTR3_27710 [Bradyrhizobium sp. LMTR 3]|nr:hypothetical protein LMTR3_27710 [Bradyrhizobium sp. LMTR 3]
MGRMDQQWLIHPDIVPDAGLASAWETQRLDPGRVDVTEFEVAIVRGKRDRKPDFARVPLLIGDCSVAKREGRIDLAQDRPTEGTFLRPSSRNSNWLCSR